MRSGKYSSSAHWQKSQEGCRLLWRSSLLGQGTATLQEQQCLLRGASPESRRHPSPQLHRPLLPHSTEQCPKPYPPQRLYCSKSGALVPLVLCFILLQQWLLEQLECWPRSEDYSSSSSLEKARQPKNKEQLGDERFVLYPMGF